MKEFLTVIFFSFYLYTNAQITIDINLPKKYQVAVSKFSKEYPNPLPKLNNVSINLN